MFNLIFGIIWTLFSSLFFVVFFGISFDNTTSNGEVGFHFNSEFIIPFLIICLFVGVGIFLIVKGARKVIKDSKTKKYGLPCYGVIRNVQQTGAYINEQPEYKAILDIINPNTNTVEQIEEIIGFDYNKFPIGSFVMCKYYEGDINFEHKIEPGEVPSSFRDVLKPATYKSEIGYNDIVFSDDREYVSIDGVKYKRI